MLPAADHGGSKMNDQPAEKPLSSGEILIVLVILAILSAILVPQYSRASIEGPQSRMPLMLRSLRTQLAVYRQRHDDNLPAIYYSGAAIIDGDAVWSGLSSAPVTNPLNGLSSVCLIDNALVDFADGTPAASPGRGNRVSPQYAGWVVNTATGRLWATAANPQLIFNETDPFAQSNYTPGN